jgi:hypothetical protein
MKAVETLLSTRLFFNTKLSSRHAYSQKRTSSVLLSAEAKLGRMLKHTVQTMVYGKVSKMMFLTCLLDENLSETLISTR